MPMPPPPPPGPPPPSGPPAPSVFSVAKSKGNSGDNRGALLQSIRQGTKLKKAVTVDKSAPMIAGRVGGSNASSSTNSSNDISRTKPTAASSNNPAANGLALGGLFAGGMPKLRSTGLRTGANQSSPNHVADIVKKPVPEPTRQNSVSPVANSNHLNEVLRRQLAGDIRNRGPPPQPPSSRNNITTDSTDSWSTTTARSVFNNKINSVAPPVPVQSSLHHNKNNNSFLHQTNTSGSINVPNNITQQPLPPKPISHGKPNVAPKPPPNIPTSKPATPPKKLVMNGRVPVSRAQSMRVPRSPPVAPPSTPPFPPAVNGKDFGTIRGLPTAFHQSQENLTHVRLQTHHHRNQTLPVNLIKSNAPQPPSFRPNMRPPVPPPPSKTGSNINLKAPLSPPPPPPTSAPPPPPPPPHRTSPAPPPPPSHTRPPPAIPTNGPPPPPVRNSSMRNGPFDFDTRFSNLFHPVTDIVAPMRFRGFTKMYSSKNVNKQQAPLPPNSVQLGNKLWESSTC